MIHINHCLLLNPTLLVFRCILIYLCKNERCCYRRILNALTDQKRQCDANALLLCTDKTISLDRAPRIRYSDAYVSTDHLPFCRERSYHTLRMERAMWHIKISLWTKKKLPYRSWISGQLESRHPRGGHPSHFFFSLSIYHFLRKML